jgi:restriction system protein
MAIPDFQTLMLPVLRSSSEAEVKISDVVEQLATQFDLSREERAELLPSGRQTIFANRVHWAKFYLGKAGLVDLTRRAHFRITERGREVLGSPPARIDIRFLSQFPEFKSFREAAPGPDEEAVEEAVQTTGLTPDEMMRKARVQLEEELGKELLSRVINAPLDFFERLIVKLVVARDTVDQSQRRPGSREKWR